MFASVVLAAMERGNDTASLKEMSKKKAPLRSESTPPTLHQHSRSSSPTHSTASNASSMTKRQKSTTSSIISLSSSMLEDQTVVEEEINSTGDITLSSIEHPLSSSYKSSRTITPNVGASLAKDLKAYNNRAPSRDTMRKVAGEIKDQRIVSKIQNLHSEVIEKRRKETKEQGLNFKEDMDNNSDEQYEFIEEVIKRLADHLEYTKIDLYKKFKVITTMEEEDWTSNFRLTTIEKIEKPKQSNRISLQTTDEDMKQFFDEQMYMVMKFWQQEFTLRLKSALQLEKEQEQREAKKVMNIGTVGIDQYRKLQAEVDALNSKVVQRDSMLSEQRAEYFKELIQLKEELTKFNIALSLVFLTLSFHCPFWMTRRLRILMRSFCTRGNC